MNPGQFVKIADSYRCFLLTQREYKASYEEEAKKAQQNQQQQPAVNGQNQP